MALAPRPRPRSTDPADYQRVPRPVAAMAKDFPAGHHIVPHSHERAQLIFAAHGAMLIATREGSWAVPPQRGQRLAEAGGRLPERLAPGPGRHRPA